MGGEIVTLHIGQAGVQISHALWELVCAEHGVNSSGRRIGERIDLDDLETGRDYVFREARGGKFVPRALLVDLEPTVIDEIRTGAYRCLWNPLNMINGKEDAASLFARGYYSQKRVEMTDVMERIRLLVEQCDRLSCFKLLYSANGGTGSGFTSALCERLSDEYGKKHKFATTVYPSPGFSELMVEPYNALLHSSTNLTFCDCVVITDNEAMLSVSEESLRLHRNGFTVPNRVLANAVTTQFLSHRYHFIGQRNTHVDDLLINLIPYPRIHFPIMAFAPFMGPAVQEYERITPVDLVRGVFEDTNQLLSLSTVSRAYISCALLFRGAVTPLEACDAVNVIKGDRMYGARFVDWCPTGFKIGVNFATPVQAPTRDTISVRNRSLGMIAGNLAIRDVWTGIGRRFDQLYEKRAFVHWYVAEGMEEGEFTLARELIQQLVEDYEAIARDAEGAFFDDLMNQSHNQSTKTSARITPNNMRRRSVHTLEPNKNQAATIDDQNSLHTIENNGNDLSVDTNQHNLDDSCPRPAIEHHGESVVPDQSISSGKIVRTVPRVSPRQRRGLHSPTGTLQLFSTEKMGNEGQQRSSNALIETALKKPMFGSNCSAAISSDSSSRSQKPHLHKHGRRRKFTHVIVKEREWSSPDNVELGQDQTAESKNKSKIPVMCKKLRGEKMYRQVKELFANQQENLLSDECSMSQCTSETTLELLDDFLRTGELSALVKLEDALGKAFGQPTDPTSLKISPVPSDSVSSHICSHANTELQTNLSTEANCSFDVIGKKRSKESDENSDGGLQLVQEQAVHLLHVQGSSSAATATNLTSIPTHSELPHATSRSTSPGTVDPSSSTKPGNKSHCCSKSHHRSHHRQQCHKAVRRNVQHIWKSEENEENSSLVNATPDNSDTSETIRASPCELTIPLGSCPGENLCSNSIEIDVLDRLASKSAGEAVICCEPQSTTPATKMFTDDREAVIVASRIPQEHEFTAEWCSAARPSGTDSYAVHVIPTFISKATAVLQGPVQNNPVNISVKNKDDSCGGDNTCLLTTTVIKVRNFTPPFLEPVTNQRTLV